MKNIQILLLMVFVAGTVVYFARMKSRLIERVLVLLFSAAAALMVSFPDTTQWMASWLGVGRGVDVVIYFMLVFLAYVCLQLYSKLRSQDERLVELARIIAISNPKLPNKAVGPALGQPSAVDLGPIRDLSQWGSDESIGPQLKPHEEYVEVP